MIHALLGKKIEQSQRFLSDGKRIPVTVLDTSGNVVVDIKTPEKHGYSAIQLGFGKRKRASKSIAGQVKKSQLEHAPFAVKEIRLNIEARVEELPIRGLVVQASDVFSPGNTVTVSGISKGKGFAGVVKRHHFKGGPRTHGQSDRERAPGSIGQTTTPGRVYKGKRMAGRMGGGKATVKNLHIVDIDGSRLFVSGQVPGGKNSIVIIEKTGDNKKFIPIYKEQDEKKGEQENAG